MSITVIVSTQRTGSTYLLNLYQKQSKTISEPFDPASSTWNTVDWSTKENTVIKTHVSEWISLPLTLRKKVDYIIQLQRRNIFEQCASLARARITEIWHSHQDEYPSCHCDRTTFITAYRHILNQISLMDLCEYDVRYYYEDFTGNPHEDSKMLDIKIVNEQVSKKLPLISETIINWEECKQWFDELSLNDPRIK